MENIQWHDSFNVGVGIIDEQHKQLFSLVNELAVAIDGGNDHLFLNNILSRLHEYTEMHFRTEEGLFAIHPGYRSHCEIHKEFENTLKNLTFDNIGESSESSIQLLKFLKTWLANHILKTDIDCFNSLGFKHNESLENLKDRLQLLTQQEKVVVVENDPTQRYLLKKNLDIAGFHTLEATNGLEALQLLEDNFDLRLIITDLNMPEMDGFELIKKVRINYSSQIYIIVITIASDRQSLIKCFELGANDYLQKPLFAQELLLRLKNGQQLLRLQSQDELIFSMAQLADCRSPETGKHLERVKEFTLSLGQHLAKHNPEFGITESWAKEISRVSPLHDIGKVGIADGILNKPGTLSADEFNMMKAHCTIGGDLISNILRKTTSRSLRLAFEITKYHHEKWDGTGYPLGLSGQDIPLSARIMALSDVYDALTTKRIYKEAFSREKARDIIVSSSNIHFDPVIVEAFEKVEKQFNLLREKLSD